MILSRPDILKSIHEQKLIFTPNVEEDQIAQVSIDLRLGRKFTVFKEKPEYLPAIRVHHSLWDSGDIWEHFEQDDFVLEPKAFVLAQTHEKICIPSDVVGLVEGRSSWARVGITIHVTAPKIDPGFDGSITLEMFNFGNVPVLLKSLEDKPAQLMLLRITTPLKDKELYGTGPDDRFQGQTSPIPHK